MNTTTQAISVATKIAVIYVMEIKSHTQKEEDNMTFEEWWEKIGSKIASKNLDRQRVVAEAAATYFGKKTTNGAHDIFTP